MEVTITINKKWFKENEKKFIDKANSNDYLEDKDTEYQIDFELENAEHLVQENGKILISGGSKSENNDIYVSFESQPELDDLIRLAQVAARQYNKVKNFFESL